MKKALIIASAFVLAIVLGFSNASWAVERPNTPECADVNGRADPDACLTQYTEPLLEELRELWFQLVRLQGKRPEDNPLVFQTDNSVCDQGQPEYYDEKLCMLSMPGKLAQAKYPIREEIRKLEAEQKLKRQKTKLVLAQTTVHKLTEENKKLAEKLQESEKQNKELSGQIAVLANELAESNKAVEVQKQKAKEFKILFLVFLAVTIVLAVLVVRKM